ncbi:MAG TPA: hypothetical protein VMR21_03000 [Vicinamibacteria bacterium]|nr:hypothetical protein [Vicinamibacteria bacterium]
MWLVYLMALIVGGGLLLFQALTGGHAAEAPYDAPDVHHGAGPGVLSIRSAIYGLFSFGFVGAALHIPGLTGKVTAFALAAASGVAATLAAGFTFATLGSPDASGAASFSEARGKRARVLLPCAADRPGKIRLELGGQQVDMKATCEGPPIAAGADVVVVDVHDDVARVAAPQGSGGAK